MVAAAGRQPLITKKASLVVNALLALICHHAQAGA